MNQFTQALLTILSLINPVICGALFVQATGGMTKPRKIAGAAKASLVILVILALAALAGARFLHVFGISLDAFQVAGGAVLSWMGFAMLRGSSSSTSSAPSADAGESLTPLILFAASPGTVTGVITLSVAHTGSGIPVNVLLAVVAALVLTWVVMVAASCAGGTKKQGLMHDVSTRFMGLIVLAMGMQLALSGLKQFFSP